MGRAPFVNFDTFSQKLVERNGAEETYMKFHPFALLALTLIVLHPVASFANEFQCQAQAPDNGTTLRFKDIYAASRIVGILRATQRPAQNLQLVYAPELTQRSRQTGRRDDTVYATALSGIHLHVNLEELRSAKENPGKTNLPVKLSRVSQGQTTWIEFSCTSVPSYP